ncbi:MAG: Transcriptional regulator, LysR family [uncultured Caballeronia sp.]|nr:MAG: Transcriptional regulator, LysR family [uncultured Caballeronia sp.]
MDRFLAMKVFVCVVESGSFSKAADALRLLAASVSRTVQALEAYLGARPEPYYPQHQHHGRR